MLRHVVEYARQKNVAAEKVLSFALVTNLSLMDDEKLDFLLDRRVQICTSLDGPADLHNKIRIFKGGNSHEIVARLDEEDQPALRRHGPGRRTTTASRRCRRSPGRA